MSSVPNTPTAAPATPSAGRVPAPAAALVGAIAVGAALAVGELAAGFTGGPSPLVAVGQVVVDYQPPGAKDLVVGLFGTNDKLALQVLVAIVALAIGAGLGVLGRGRPTAASLAIGAFAVAGLLASLRDPESSLPVAVLVAAGETLVGSSLLGWLLDSAVVRAAPTREGGSPAGPAGGMPDWARRRLLIRGGGIAAASVVAVGLGRSLTARSAAPTTSTPFPEPQQPASLPNGADISTPDLTAEGLTPIVVPNEQFYRIDTALLVPSVDVATWTLRVHGLVDREVTLTYDQLIQLPIIEQYVTIACVSNEVGGNLVGNASWRGVPLRTVLDMAGVQKTATQLVGRSVDGFTVGMPVAWVMNELRVPLIAIGMNGQPLPRVHGYPARLIVPGLYGYVSATKWLSEIELTTMDAFDAYWVRLGWAKEAPILTQSRIDVPRDGATVKAGPAAIAGVAWAPDRGIDRVEVSIDGGPWQAALFSEEISRATWVQWVLRWNATTGDHVAEVRATDARGEVQTADVTTPFPDGARGHHKIGFHVA
ncbi:MAG TPA: molybdopterin-dependent oxidoreductase [Candidatus Limnocylindrales bacterium]|nr:molybdopterin-dependent oxidoreductase [Candidatus Limnocylindrales bacterium]